MLPQPEHPEFESQALDIRDREGVERLVASRARDLELVVHAAAQPSQDWAASDPHSRADAMVDIHCHILPGLDDGVATIEESLELARAAYAAGVKTIAATPHIREDHPLPLDTLDARLEVLRQALDTAEIPLEVVRGGEVALSKLIELDETLNSLRLGRGRYLLVETPHAQAPSLLETALFGLQLRGFRSVLAHPELGHVPARPRPTRAYSSVTAMSVTGGFGPAVKAYTLAHVRRRLGAQHRPTPTTPTTPTTPSAGRPGSCPPLDVLESEFDFSRQELAWFTDSVGNAMIDGRDLPAGKLALSSRPSGWRRVRDRVGLA